MKIPQLTLFIVALLITGWLVGMCAPKGKPVERLPKGATAYKNTQVTEERPPLFVPINPTGEIKP